MLRMRAILLVLGQIAALATMAIVKDPAIWEEVVNYLSRGVDSNPPPSSLLASVRYPPRE